MNKIQAFSQKLGWLLDWAKGDRLMTLKDAQKFATDLKAEWEAISKPVEKEELIDDLPKAIARLKSLYISQNCPYKIGDYLQLAINGYDHHFGILKGVSVDDDGEFIYEVQRYTKHEDLLPRKQRFREDFVRPITPELMRAIALPKKTYSGWLQFFSNGEESDILALTDELGTATEDEILAELLKPDIQRLGDFCTVRYWLSDRAVSLDEVQEEWLKTLYGQTQADYEMRYSEITGYLFTTEDLQVGGHDLLEELKENVGKYAVIEIEFG